MHVIIRHNRERTLENLKIHLKLLDKLKIIGCISEVPFAATLEKSLQIAHDKPANGVLMLDADITLHPENFDNFINHCSNYENMNIITQPLVYDKFSQIFRSAGIKYYSPQAIKICHNLKIDLTKHNRPESALISHAVRMHQTRFETTTHVCGLHDFNQYNHHIILKNLLHSRKHTEMFQQQENRLKYLSAYDSDFSLSYSTLTIDKFLSKDFSSLLLYNDEYRNKLKNFISDSGHIYLPNQDLLSRLPKTMYASKTLNQIYTLIFNTKLYGLGFLKAVLQDNVKK